MINYILARFSSKDIFNIFKPKNDKKLLILLNNWLEHLKRFGGEIINTNNDLLTKELLESRKALKIFKRKLRFKYLFILLLIILVFLLMIYGASSFGKTDNQFTIAIGNNALTKLGSSIEYSHLITLSTDSAFTNPITNLSCKGIKNMTNISVLDIPDDVDLIDGEHNGMHYLAYSFYLKNLGEDGVVTESININYVYRHIDKAIRVRVYRNGLDTTYAKMRNDGSNEYGCVSFLNEAVVYEKKYDLITNEVVRYTVVIWLEGDDPDCTNTLYGGEIKLSMNFFIDEN